MDECVFSTVETMKYKEKSDSKRTCVAFSCLRLSVILFLAHPFIFHFLIFFFP